MPSKDILWLITFTRHEEDKAAFDLFAEIDGWLYENNIEYEKVFTVKARDIGIRFESKEDAMAFKLRWM